MKTAICISGGIKFPEKSLESLKKFHPNNFKIFIHTWTITDAKSYLNNISTPKFACWTQEQIKENFIESTKDKELLEKLMRVLDRYDCEEMMIESFEDRKQEFEEYFNSLSFPSYERHDIGFLSMAYSFYTCNQLKTKYEKMNNMKFDKVVRMRFDSDIINEIHLDKLKKFPLTLEKNTGDWGGLSDQFAIGDSESMDHYCNMYHNLVNMQHVNFHPETLVSEHLSNVDYIELPFRVRINGRDVLS